MPLPDSLSLIFMKTKYLIPLIAFLSLTVLLGIGLTMDPKVLPSALINKPAPNFELPLLHDTNSNFSPVEYKGKRWILNVWASWCPSCRDEHPIFNEIAKRTSIPLVGLNYKDKPSDAIQWLAVRGNPYDRIPSDLQGDVGVDWGVYGAPETFVIDEQGQILYRHAGPINPKLLETEIAPFFPEMVSLFEQSRP